MESPKNMQNPEPMPEPETPEPAVHEDISKITPNQILDNLVEQDTIYNFLLDEIYESIESDKELFGNKSISVSRPEIIFKNSKTQWTNFSPNCQQINCNRDHFNKFIVKELGGIKTSINAEGVLLMAKRQKLSVISEIYKKYISTYSRCNTCKSINTKIIRNGKTKMDYVECQNTKCNSSRVVQKL